jgi:hypothetical protein
MRLSVKDRVNFAPNIPQTVALEFPEGRKLETGNVMYSLVEGWLTVWEREAA